MKSKTGGKTRTSRKTEADSQRLKDLSKLLAQARQDTLARVRAHRKQEQEDAVEMPADDMEVARSLEDVETEAGLIERYEYQLKAIDAALSRLERGRYGICEKCKEEIPVERLKAMPFTAYCIDCQKKRSERIRPGEGDVDEPSRHVWTPPDELKESVEK